MEFLSLFLDGLKKDPLDPLLDLSLQAENSLSMDLFPFHDSFRYRARHTALKLACHLIDLKGELNRPFLKEMLERLRGGLLYVLGPGREGDSLIYAHLLRCLEKLFGSPSIWKAIQKFSPPICHRAAEEFIRKTLWPEPCLKIGTAQIRRAVLAAWLTLLRQSTGSCFATAPAILIQEKEPLSFLKDLYDLLTTGQLKRVLGGKEYAVPLSLSSGGGEIQRTLFSLEQAIHSPGIRIALEEAGVPFSQMERIEEATTVEKFLYQTLLKKEGLTEQEVFEQESLSHLQMTPLFAKQSAVYYQKPSERAQRVARLKKNYAKAINAFEALGDCALLRAWEYTLASLCDVKLDFAKWNLYLGIGFHPDQKGGIGALIYDLLSQKLEKYQAEISQLEMQYERALYSAKSAESLLRSGEAELSRAVQGLHQIGQAKQKLIEEAEALAQFFPSLMRQLDEKLREFFQELFDPSLRGEEGHLFEDGEAGFRLVYKHGLSDASQWTPIRNGKEYISSLRDFFSLIEPQMILPRILPQRTISEIFTRLIQRIQEPDFLKLSMERAKNNGRKSPWDYFSGGTMQTLLQTYWQREAPFQEAQAVPHSEEELLAFLFREKRKGTLLMHSPTHAFLYHPSFLPADLSSFLQLRRLSFEYNAERQEYLADRLSQQLPEGQKALFWHLFRKKPFSETALEFREHLIACMGGAKEKVDALFYESGRLLSEDEAHESARSILSELGFKQLKISISNPFTGSFELYQIVRKTILGFGNKPISGVDWDWEIIQKIRDRQIAPLAPLLFAETNWSAWFFGFVIHPITSHLELWRLNRIGAQGFPMSDWEEWLSGSNQAPWMILTHPEEYQGEGTR